MNQTACGTSGSAILSGVHAALSGYLAFGSSRCQADDDAFDNSWRVWRGVRILSSIPARYRPTAAPRHFIKFSEGVGNGVFALGELCAAF